MLLDEQTRDFYLLDEIDDTSVAPIIEGIYAANKEGGDEPVRIFINSPGGWVSSALSLITAIENSQVLVEIHALGEVFSSAFLIYVAGHERHAYKHSVFMYHAISAGHAGPLDQLKQQYEYTTLLQQMADDVVLAYTDFTREELNSLTDNTKAKFMGYLEAYEKRVVDVLDISEAYPKDCELVAARFPQEEPVELDLSNIPVEDLKAFVAKYAK